MKRLFLLLLFINLSLFAQKKVIIVTIEPQKYIVEKLVQNTMKVKSIYKGSNFDIRFKKLALKEIAASDIYMTIGLDTLEKPLLSQLHHYNKSLEIFDISSNIRRINDNPYVWMDPLNARQLAKATFVKLSEMNPKKRSFYRENYEKFAKELDDLYVKIKLHFSNSSFSVMVFDDYWDYYLSRFDFRYFKQEKRVLKAEEIPHFISQSKRRNIQMLLVSPKTSVRAKKSVASNASLKVIENDIFNYAFTGEMLLLATKIKK